MADAHTRTLIRPNEATISTAVQQFFEGKKGIKKLRANTSTSFISPRVSWETYLAETINGWPDHNIIIGSDFDHGDAVATWPKTVDYQVDAATVGRE